MQGAVTFDAQAYNFTRVVNEVTDYAIVLLDPTGHIQSWNAGAARITGYQSNEIIGAHFRGMYTSEDLEKEVPITALEEARQGGKSRHEGWHIRKDGSRFWGNIEITALHDDHRNVIGFVKICRDYTDRKLAEDELQSHAQKLEKLEDKFRSLLESAPDAMVIVDETGVIQLVNAQTESMFGYSREDLIGKTVELLMPDRYEKAHYGHRYHFFTSPKVRQMGEGFELFGKKSSGQEFPVEISLSPLETDEGRLVSAAIRDITNRKKAEEKFRNLLEAAPDAIIIVNDKGVIQLVNVQTEKLFGYHRSEIIGKRIEMLMPERYQGSHQDHRTNYFGRPKVRQMGSGLELFGKRKNGEEFPLEISLSPLETEEGMLVSSAIRDISEKKRLENEIREANINLEKKVQQRTMELEVKNKELAQFAYVASHDLQEPLRTTSSFVELLREKCYGRLDGEADQFIDYIIQASDRMRTLINDLLEYSRIGRKTSLQIVNCQTILSEVMADLDNSIKEQEAVITSTELPVINGYATELKQLFQNLISNSVKFRNKNSPPQIHIRAHKKDEYWEFAVQDNGIGIEAKHKDRIFVIFQRLHTRTEYEGSGIGLSHCKKIVELHGGRIWVESRPGEGSTFYFTIHAF